LHRHGGRRRLRPSSAHAEGTPSPARAEPHDAAAWLPLPEPDSLPPVEHLLAGDPAAEPVTPRDVPTLPSPARAAPHDETAWLPLPEIDELPAIDELLTPTPGVEVPPRRGVPVVVPSPARAEPHDAAAWLPLPDLHGLPPNEGDGTPAPRHGRRRRLPHIPVRAMFIALIVAAVLGGVGYGASRILDKGDDVELRVDGKVVSAETGVSSVGSFLREQKISLGEHDRVMPGPDAPIHNDMVVKVIRAFPVVVDFDGTSSTVFTTRSEPAAFLADAYPGAAVAIRKPPKRIIGNVALEVRTVKSGSLTVDGRTVLYQNEPANTVRELLDDHDVKLGAEDRTSPVAVDETLPDKSAIVVKRINMNQPTRNEPYTVPDETLPDPGMDVGTTRVAKAVPGLRAVTYDEEFSNGVLVKEIPISKVPIVPAKPRITYFGTKADPKWDKLAECETGGNWAAHGPEYQGGLGIYYKNWLHYRDKDFPKNAGDATREQQIVVAIKIRNEHGWGAWGCARNQLHYTGKS
jgi:resuscitation-promoting factor RpfB